MSSCNIEPRTLFWRAWYVPTPLPFFRLRSPESAASPTIPSRIRNGSTEAAPVDRAACTPCVGVLAESDGLAVLGPAGGVVHASVMLHCENEEEL